MKLTYFISFLCFFWISCLQAATIVVTSAADTTDQCTLRAAIESANSNQSIGGCTAGSVGMDTIQFDPRLRQATIFITREMKVTKALTIVGIQENDIQQRITLDGRQQAKFFNIRSGSVFNVSDLNFRNAYSQDKDNGGVIKVVDKNHTVTVDRCFFSDNFAEGDFNKGGAIYSAAKVIVRDSAFFNNTASSGGGIYAKQIHSERSVFSGNRATNGGGIFAGEGKAFVMQSVFASNHAAAMGGGIFADTVHITNSTLTHNVADYNGGGITVWNLLASHLTLVNNDAQLGSAIYTAPNGGKSNITNSIIIGNVANPQCSEEKKFAESRQNIVWRNGENDPSCGQFIPIVSHSLEQIVDMALQNNAHRLVNRSPAIQAAMPSKVTYDQFGNPRQNPPSLGAVE